MAKEADIPADMAHARQSEGIKVIFDQESSASPRSCTSSTSSCDGGRLSASRAQKEQERPRRRHRSSSSSSSSSPRPRSRSHPRCHRPSSRCRCDGHHGKSRRSRAHPRSDSRSPSTYRSSHHRRHRRSPARPRSPSRRCSRPTHQSKSRVSQSRADRSRSRSPISRQQASLSLQVVDKRELLKAAKDNAEKILGVQELVLPESVKPILPEQPEKSREASPEPSMWVRVDPKKTASQSEEEEEPEEESSPSTSPKRRIISFSINNSVAKPTVAPFSGKVTARVDSYESRKPYGHWIPVKSGRTSRPRKPTKSH